MTNFTVRVELHDADSDDYDELHKKMKNGGFKTTITSDDGTVYDLPPAEYNYENSSMSTGNVRDKAYDIAKTVKKSPAVLVTKSDGRSWKGLDFH